MHSDPEAGWPLETSHRENGFGLGSRFYTSDSIFERDRSQIFARAWLYAGHAQSLPEKGDWFRLEIGRDQILIVRGRDGVVRAFFNVCRHRGSLVCTEDRGNAARFTCPYHQWTFATDGALISARSMGPDFDRSDYGLHALAVHVFCGLIFINYDCNAPLPIDLSDAVEARFGAYALDRAKIAHTERYVVDANWKLVVENSRECYHCGVGHPQYSDAVGFVAAIDSERHAAEERARQEALDVHVAEAGLLADPVRATADSWFHMRRFPLRGGFRSESLDGTRVAPLLGTLPTENVGAMAIVTLPNFLLEAVCDYAMTLRILPIDATRTEAVVQWLVHSDARDGTDYDLETLTKFWKLTSEQDWNLCEVNQLGVSSTGYTPGPYAPAERGVNNFVDWYLRQLGR